MTDNRSSSDSPDRQDEPLERAPRRNVMLSALIETFQGTSSRHRVRDVSIGGARIDEAGSLVAGSTVLVTVGVLEAVAATVVWVRPPLAGLKFAQNIDVEKATARTALSGASRPSGASITPTAGWINNTRNPYRC